MLVTFGLPLTGKGLFPARVIGSPGVFRPNDDASRCMRALELPELLSHTFRDDFTKEFRVDDPAAVVKKTTAMVEGSRWLRFDTHRSNRVRLLLGVEPEIAKQITSAAAAKWILIRERDNKHNLISETPLASLQPKTVNALTDLPSTWTANPGPWYFETTSVVTFLESLKLALLFVEIKPNARTTAIEVAYTGDCRDKAHRGGRRHRIVPCLRIGSIQERRDRSGQHHQADSDLSRRRIAGAPARKGNHLHHHRELRCHGNGAGRLHEQLPGRKPGMELHDRHENSAEARPMGAVAQRPTRTKNTSSTKIPST